MWGNSYSSSSSNGGGGVGKDSVNLDISDDEEENMESKEQAA